MPATRKASGGHATGPAKQSKLSFAHRVTKPVSKIGAKDLGKPSPLSKQIHPEKESPPPSKVDVEVEGDVVVELEPEEVAEPETPAPAPTKSDAELEAEKVTDAQVNKYWRGLEAERIASRVHQGDLSVSEKVLRYFDVSSQYGPCIGVARMKRWTRAERLGLNPPIEVLAVLLKEEQKGTKDVERAHMDEIMNPTAVGAA